MMDDGWLLDTLCDRGKPVLYSENSYIMREGDPIEEMLIVTKGLLESTTEISSDGYFSRIYLRKGDICGDLLLRYLDPHPSSCLPTSTRTVKSLTEAEGFILLPDDVKFVASHFNRLHSVNLKHMFRYYSGAWKLWGACYIQAAWRVHCRRKASKILPDKRDKQQIRQDTQRNLGATLYVSRFVSKALRYRQVDSAECSSDSEMLPLVPHKPADPEFSKKEA